MFAPIDRVKKLTRSIDFDADIQTYLSQVPTLRAAGAEAVQDGEHEVIFRRFMTDYWAAVACMGKDEFEQNLPGSPRHLLIKEDRKQLAGFIVGLLPECSSPEDLHTHLASELANAEQLVFSVVPLLIAKLTMNVRDYVDFLVFEAPCWTYKNVSMQRMVQERLDSKRAVPWTPDDVLAVSQWVDAKVIPKFYKLKRTPAWDELEFSVGRR